MTDMHSSVMDAMLAKMATLKDQKFQHYSKFKIAQCEKFNYTLKCVQSIKCRQVNNPSSCDMIFNVTPTQQNIVTAALILFDQLAETKRSALISEASPDLINSLYNADKQRLQSVISMTTKLELLLKALNNNQLSLAKIWINLGANPTDAMKYIIQDYNLDIAYARSLQYSNGSVTKMLVFLSQHGGDINMHLRELAESRFELQYCVFYMNVDINKTWCYKTKQDRYVDTTLLMHMILSGKHECVRQILREMLARQHTGWSLEQYTLDVLLELHSVTSLSSKPFPHLIKHICGYFPPPQHHILDIEKTTLFYNKNKSKIIDDKNCIMCAHDQQCPDIVAMLTLYHDRMFL